MEIPSEGELAYTLPSPTGTPYRTPSSSRSQRSRTFGSASPSSSPPPLPPFDTKDESNGPIDPATDPTISPLDPRRFTPTLHASLVSEILSLRREVEERTKHIEHLESDLHTTRQENDNLTRTLTTTSKESRSLMRQMKLLEGGTLSALSELSKERDNAQNDLVEVRKRLEQSQKKSRNQDDDAERMQAGFERERIAWATEKRNLETKVHIVEGRLRVVLNEVTQSQLPNGHIVNGVNLQEQPHVRDSPSKHRSASPTKRRNDSPNKRRSAALDHRRQSTTSNGSDMHGGRLSRPASSLSLTNGHSKSLADELAFDDDEVDHHLEDIEEQDGYSSPDALPEEHGRPISVQSRRSAKAYKVLGLPLDRSIPETNGFHRLAKPADIPSHVLEESLGPVKPAPKYVDCAVQYTPPPSPTTGALDGAAFTSERSFGHSHWDSDATRPDTVVPGVIPISPANGLGSNDAPWTRAATKPKVMVSATAQTTQPYPELMEPPEKAIEPVPSAAAMASVQAEMKNRFTQTDVTGIEMHSPFAVTAPHLMSIPTIAIIPPTSRPVTPTTSVVLPPHTKNASCQANLPFGAEYASSGTQTEEIRIDKRVIELPSTLTGLAKRSMGLPPKTLPSAPPSAMPNSSRRRFRQTPTPPLTKSNRSSRDLTSQDIRLPPANDCGPLAEEQDSPVKRPIRSSSMFAGFDDTIDDDLDGFLNERIGDDEIFHRPTQKFVLRSGKLISQDPVLEEDSDAFAAEAGESVAMGSLRLSEDSLSLDFTQSANGRETPPTRPETTLSQYAQQQAAMAQPGFRQLRRVPSSKAANFRRAALISSGTAAHSATQPASLGVPVPKVNPPPFPVPTRFSSRKVGKSASEGARSITPTSGMSPTKKRKGKSIKPSLRKSRSSTAISLERQRSHSPPVAARISIVPDVPKFPPMPVENITTLRGASTVHGSRVNGVKPPAVAARQPSHMKADSAASSLHQTSVVDAIAQTMVGEWMFKYVRRRKSFGIPESKPVEWDPNRNPEEISASVTSTGVRHRRWVWVAPYERAIMWSSKQPTSGTALMGKSGRKLVVQSVLDVKDDNPMPKGTPSVQQFNRSILILTPERALKFTALTRERHFVWLTALSFLSHSPLTIGDLAALPPPPSDENTNPPPPSLAGSLRRRNIRDSIMMTKGSRNGQRSFTADPPVSTYARGSPDMTIYDPISDAALPPSIPRFHQHHSRKRSNTAPRAPPSSFRSFSQRDSVSQPRPSQTYTRSVAGTTAASSDRGVYTPSLGMQSVQGSRRGSEASATQAPISRKPSASQINTYFDHVGLMGTMKMDAFMESRDHNRARGSYKTKQGRRKDLGYWGVENGEEMNAKASQEEGPRRPSRSDDPFRGF